MHLTLLHDKRIATWLLGLAMGLLAAATAEATVYYVDGTGGSDSNPGTSRATAWSARFRC